MQTIQPKVVLDGNPARRVESCLPAYIPVVGFVFAAVLGGISEVEVGGVVEDGFEYLESVDVPDGELG